MKMRFVFATLALVALCLTFAATSALALEEFDFTSTRSFAVGSSSEVGLESMAGDLTCEAADGTDTTVEIVVRVRAENEEEALDIRDESNIRVDGSDGELEATVERPKDFSRRLRKEYGKKRSLSVRFHVMGPQGASGYLSTVSGGSRSGNRVGRYPGTEHVNRGAGDHAHDIGLD